MDEKFCATMDPSVPPNVKSFLESLKAKIPLKDVLGRKCLCCITIRRNYLLLQAKGAGQQFEESANYLMQDLSTC